MAEYSLEVKIGLSFTYTNYISGSHNMAEYSLVVKIGLSSTYTNIILVVTIWLNTL
jgi:hypothetical protein